MNESPDEAGGDAPPPQWPQHQIYFVTVEWEDAPHQPESPERVAQQLRQLIEHDHDHGAQMTPARFVVRVKTDDGASEIKGLATHRHQHQHGPQASPGEKSEA
jgi:hypothetical protein